MLGAKERLTFDVINLENSYEYSSNINEFFEYSYVL